MNRVLAAGRAGRDWLGAGSRVTQFEVDAAGGDLTRIVSPELCETKLVHDASHRPIGYVHPTGRRTT